MKKMLTESKKLNIAIILLIIFYATWILMGILYASTGFMPYHQIKPSIDPDWKILIMFLVRYNGFLFIQNGILGLLIINVGFQKKEKWAWIYFLISGSFITIPLIVLFFTYGVMVGVTDPIPSVLIFTVIWIIAMIISYKEFFGE
jgi:hypothetical protein